MSQNTKRSKGNTIVAITYSVTSYSELSNLSEEEKIYMSDYHAEQRIAQKPETSNRFYSAVDSYRTFFSADNPYSFSNHGKIVNGVSYINRPAVTLIRAWDGSENVAFCFILPSSSSGAHTNTESKLRQDKLDFLSSQNVPLEECFSCDSCVKLTHQSQGIFTEIRKRAIIEAKKLGYFYSISGRGDSAAFHNTLVHIMAEFGATYILSDTLLDYRSEIYENYYGYWDCRDV